MPLPDSTNQEWPPIAYSLVFDQMRKWSAWWSNDLERLQAAYSYEDPRKSQYIAQHDSLLHKIGRVAQRWFVGEARADQSRSTKLPVPLASEICQGSADLLFADPLTIHCDDQDTQDRIEELCEENFADVLAEAAESAAALGGVFLRVTWDPKVADAPFTTIVDADGALPEFMFGRLQAVTFSRAIWRDGDKVWRHLERHELDARGDGVILHGLYTGDEFHLGVRVSLTERPETAPLAVFDDLNVEGTINTQSAGLAVHYVPNQTPNRVWRHLPTGRYLGRPDIDGVEHLLDELAETMSDWMRARRVARARIVLPASMIKSDGAGKGAYVNPDQEVFTPLPGGIQSNNMPLSQQIQVLQPTFDPSGYKATADALIEQIIREAGYSPATFGIENGQAKSMRTATEVEAQERRTLLTRKRKVRAWTPALRDHVTKLLAVDNTFFHGTNNLAEDIMVEFADGVQESQFQLAQTVQALAAAESASLEIRVGLLHPDWDDAQVMEEVARIKAEQPGLPSPVIDPFGGGDAEPAVGVPTD